MTTVREIALQIEERLRDTRQALADAREALKAVEVEEVALARALRALEPGNPLVAPTAKAAAKAPKSTPEKRQQVSDETLDRVRFAVLSADAPVMVSDVAEAVGVSKSAASAALNVLRSRDMVRLAGVAKRPGSPALYAPMNGGDHV